MFDSSIGILQGDSIMSEEKSTEDLQRAVLRKVAARTKNFNVRIKLEDEDERLVFCNLKQKGCFRDVSGEAIDFPDATLSDYGWKLLEELEAKK